MTELSAETNCTGTMGYFESVGQSRGVEDALMLPNPVPPTLYQKMRRCLRQRPSRMAQFEEPRPVGFLSGFQRICPEPADTTSLFSE